MTQQNSSTLKLRLEPWLDRIEAAARKGGEDAGWLFLFRSEFLDLLDEREMSKQVVETLRDLHSNWRRIIEESDADGYPLIENLLYSAIDDLGGHE